MGGRLSSVTANATKAQQQTRTFHYDGRGFLDREVQPESGTVTYEYDAQGNVNKKMTPTGTILYAYDEAGRLKQVGTPQAPLRMLSYFADGSAKGQLEWARAFNDRLVGSSCLRFEVRQDFTYNETHRRLETEKTSLFQGGTPLEKWSQGYAYDGAGQVTQVDYPACVAGCNATGRSQTFTYSMGRPTKIPGFTNPITYNDNGLVKQIPHSNGVTFTQTPDASGMARPGSIGTNRSWQSESYQYDASGNIKKIGGKLFIYDLSSRLTSAAIPGVSQPYRGYTYDVFGNLTQVAQGASAENITTYVSYTPNPATNQLQGAGYDSSGRLFSYQGSTYSWDVLNNVTKVNTGSVEWVHTYDAKGERVWSWKTSPSPRIDTYALRGLDGKVLTDFTKTSTGYTWEDYVYHEGQLLAASLWDGNTTHFVHFDVDHLGSVRQETDDNGAVIKYRDFWPYGEEATPPSGTEQMKFTGHERDLGVISSIADDLDYMHARYYRPLFARFLSPDPVSGDHFNPQSWNGYSYVTNRPLTYVDPEGRVEGLPIPFFLNAVTSLGAFVFFGSVDVICGNICQVATEVNRQSYKTMKVIEKGFFAVMGLLLPTLGGGETTTLIGLGLDAGEGATAAGAGAEALADVSRQSLKHIAKHLDAFKKLDSTYTLEEQVALGKQIASDPTRLIGTAGGRKIFQQAVTIGGKKVVVRVVYNTYNKLRSVYIANP